MATIEEALGIALDHHAGGRLAEAEILYGRILQADPRNAATLHLAGVLACQTGRPGQGLGLLRRAVAEDPAAAAYRIDQAKALLAVREWGAAAAALRPALALAPDAAEGCDLLGLAERHAGDLDAAIAALEHGFTLAPERAEMAGRLALLRRQRGVEHLRRSRPDLAVADFRRAVPLAPEEAEPCLQLAGVLFDCGRFAAAVEAYRRVLALDPSQGAALFNLGIALTKSGGADVALAVFRRVARLDPGHIGVRDALTLALEPCDAAEAARWSAETLALKQARAESEVPPLPAVPREAAARARDIVAFSLWGTREVYTQGAVANARAVPALFPGWICRFYHDESVPPALIAELGRLGAETVAMPAGSGPSQGLFWRFLAADDPTVARFLCRDCDSRPTLREKAAVAEWIASGLPFHVMRDHLLHTDVILAGMWGGRAGLLPPMAPVVAAVADREADRWQDQRFLAEWVWPRIRDRVLVHDSAHPGAGRPFPPAPDDPVSPHIGAKVLELRTIDAAARAERTPGASLPTEAVTRHGPLRFLPDDSCAGRSLALYGEFLEAAQRLCASLLEPGGVVAEAGAGVGAHTVPLARRVGPGGQVHAVEPREDLRGLLVHNLAVNGMGAVVVHRSGVVGMDGVERLDLLKVDVGSDVIAAVREAAGVIVRCRPALYLENDREDRLGELIALVQGFAYRLWWHIVPLFDPGNHAGQGHNGFPGVVALNLLGLPAERSCPLPGLPEVTGPAQSWRETAWSA
ncbi:tetratricopeptide repeat protein [Azospirillum sp. YIM B02556]|uniref:Tetratricopeptide repeat protein n=1 Tax=Azospirillum endophyticum TaxID=2800326 RepID=A0ABS1F6B6_9PROT|nr:protein arginine N-methyltransferase [Azospirillum endophyticum]MBK1838903.1 tetratricopeptide repeat protein [Azospirillum endophyticum]